MGEMSVVAYFTHRCLCAGGGSKKLVHFFRGLIDPLGGVVFEGQGESPFLLYNCKSIRYCGSFL